ncbi:unnamed protein product [Prorocentrum cordatum]|uniref:Uncharacterized protein n=1 Tax=Prorocentrum cordatum TaxID=2364126 RepID=A0ABN9WA11_9DINO|nr:unnamed protein product [Polarella glacialis]
MGFDHEDDELRDKLKVAGVAAADDPEQLKRFLADIAAHGKRQKLGQQIVAKPAHMDAQPRGLDFRSGLFGRRKEVDFFLSSESRAKGFKALAAQRRQAPTVMRVALPAWPRGSNLVQWSSYFRLLLAVHAAFFATGTLAEVCQPPGDVFTSVIDGDLGKVEWSLSSAASGCTEKTVCAKTRQTALHVAAENGQLECARLLLSKRADPSALDTNRDNVLHIACRRGNLQLAELLLEGGTAGTSDAPRSHARSRSAPACAAGGMGGGGAPGPWEDERQRQAQAERLMSQQNAQGVRVLSRMAAFPAAEAAAACAFDDGAVSAAQLAELVAQPKVQAAILVGADFDEVEVQKVVYDVAGEHVGREVPDAMVADGQGFAPLGSLGSVAWLGQERLVERASADRVDHWKEKREESEGDSRILGLHRGWRKRKLALHGAAVRGGPGSMVVYESEWRQESSVGEGTAALREHRSNTEALRLARQDLPAEGGGGCPAAALGPPTLRGHGCVLEAPEPASSRGNNFAKGAQWSPDGSVVLAAHDDQTLRLYSAPAEARGERRHAR